MADQRDHQPHRHTDVDLDVEGDATLTLLGSARAELDDELTDPDSATNRALLADLLAVPPAPAGGDHVRSARSGRRLAMLGAAAAAIVAVAVTVGPVGDDGRSAAALIKDAREVSQRAFAPPDDSPPYDLTEPGPSDVVPVQPDDVLPMDALDDGVLVVASADPAALLALLDEQADFEIVGEEEIDGELMTHLRATNPEVLTQDALMFGDGDATFTGIDLWIDGDDLVRRVTMTIDEPVDGYDTATMSVRPLSDGTFVGELGFGE